MTIQKTSSFKKQSKAFSLFIISQMVFVTATVLPGTIDEDKHKLAAEMGGETDSWWQRLGKTLSSKKDSSVTPKNEPVVKPAPIAQAPKPVAQAAPAKTPEPLTGSISSGSDAVQQGGSSKRRSLNSVGGIIDLFLPQEVRIPKEVEIVHKMTDNTKRVTLSEVAVDAGIVCDNPAQTMKQLRLAAEGKIDGGRIWRFLSQLGSWEQTKRNVLTAPDAFIRWWTQGPERSKAVIALQAKRNAGKNIINYATDKQNGFIDFLKKNSVSEALQKNSTTVGLTAFLASSLFARDMYYFAHRIKPDYKKLLPNAYSHTSIAARSMAIINSLYRTNSNNDYDHSAPEKIQELIDTITFDIRAGAVSIRDAQTQEIIDVSNAAGKEKALIIANIAYTIDQQLAELKTALAYLETYQYVVDFGEDYYRCGWKFDLDEANKAARIIPGIRFYEITNEMSTKRNDYMKKDEESIWQLSRLLFSYGMPHSYSRAKKAWWIFKRQEDCLQEVRKLFITLPQ